MEDLKTKTTNQPPPLLRPASINALWKTDFGQARGTKHFESPITESTSFGSLRNCSGIVLLVNLSQMPSIVGTLKYQKKRIQNNINMFTIVLYLRLYYFISLVKNYNFSILKYIYMYRIVWTGISL